MTTRILAALLALSVIFNIFFVIGAATVFYAVALIALAFHATIFEF